MLAILTDESVASLTFRLGSRLFMRYCPQRPFPPYAYIPGRRPHPVSDPRGHSFGLSSLPVVPLDPGQPRRSDEFLFAIDLFNHGYYWEAHEAWEQLWHAAGRSGPVATLLKGLIKLAAAGVKAREGNATGVKRHAHRAAELLRTAGESHSELQGLFEAIRGPQLLEQSTALFEQPIVDMTDIAAGNPVLPIQIEISP